MSQVATGLSDEQLKGLFFPVISDIFCSSFRGPTCNFFTVYKNKHQLTLIAETLMSSSKLPNIYSERC